MKMSKKTMSLESGNRNIHSYTVEFKPTWKQVMRSA